MAIAESKAKLKFRRLPDDRPDLIMDAAEKVFGEKGYDAATLDRIAKVAGITKGTIYLYFSNKKDLFLRMMQRRVIAIMDNLKEKGLGEGSLEELLDVLLPAIREFMRDPAYPNFLRLLLAESGRFPQIGKEFFQKVAMRGMALGKVAYESDASSGKLKQLDPGVVLRCLMGMHIIFVVTQEILRAKEYDPLEWDEVTKTIDTIFWDGVKRRD